MSAGTAYAKRYGAGFVDLPTKTTPIDSTFLNAVEVALLQLIGVAPTVDGQVAQWDNANTRFGPALILNKNVDAAAAIAKSKLDFTGANGIVNADIAGAAAIARSKLNFGAGLVDADISATAAIAASKISGGLYLAAPQKYSTLIDIVSSAAETHILQAAGYSVAAGLLGIDGIARVTLWGDILNNTGGNYSFQLKIKLGATTVYDSGLQITMVPSANRRDFRLQFEIGNTGVANAQRMAGTVHIGDVDAPTTGLGYIVDPVQTGNLMGANNWTGTPIGGNSAEDTTTAKTLAATWTHTNNSATAETRIYKSLIEFI